MLISLYSISNAIAQDSLVIVALNGIVTQKVNDTSRAKPLAFGDVIKNGKTVSHGHSYVLFIADSSLTPLEYRSSGVLNLNEDLAKRKTFPENLRENIKEAFDTIVSATKRKNRPFYKKDESELLKLEGDILALSPTSTRTNSKYIKLKWKGYYDNLYWIDIYDVNTNKLYFTFQTAATEYDLKISDVRFPVDRCLYWRVRINNSEQSSLPRCIYKINIQESSYIDIPVFYLEENFPSENSPFNRLMLAIFYEKASINHLAEEQYRMAYLMSGKYEPYKRIYYDFLARRNDKIIYNH